MRPAPAAGPSPRPSGQGSTQHQLAVASPAPSGAESFGSGERDPAPVVEPGGEIVNVDPLESAIVIALGVIAGSHQARAPIAAIRACCLA